MKNLFNYKDFITESKKGAGASPLSLFKKDTENVISDMFQQAKKQKFEYDSEGFPTSVEFEVVYNDWFCKYDKDLKNEFTEGVLKKREYEPVFSFSSKDQEGKDKDTNKNIYTLKFKIKKEKIDQSKIETKKSEETDEQLLKKLKSKKISDTEKEKIMDILKDRGVDYKNPFDEDEYEDNEEDLDKKAAIYAKEKSEKEKKSKKKNESMNFGINENYMSDISVIAQGSDSLEDFKERMKIAYPNLFKTSSEKLEDLENWLDLVYEDSVKNVVTEKSKTSDMVIDDINKNGELFYHSDEDMQGHLAEMGYSWEEGSDDWVEQAFSAGYTYVDEKGWIEKEQLKDNEGLNVNEGLIGKIAKVLSKEEYNKTLKYVLDNCSNDCSKESVKNALKNMVFNKITKKAIEEDSKLMNSLVEEIFKDVKKELDKKETFGSKKWQEKYGVTIKEEKEEVSYNRMINETVIKKFEDMENLNDVFNKVYEDNKIIESLDTIKKFNENAE